MLRDHKAAHGEAGDGAIFSFARDIVRRLDLWHDLVQERLSEEIGITVDAAVGSSQTPWARRKDISP